ncbi:hypothetical protein FACS1894208_05740 [Clostridia bacterium]|nr:hypothetical protein FACS1894208_05740 [Clostridia bacterium]
MRASRPVRTDASFILLLTLLIFSGGEVLYPFLGAAVLHEGAHIVATLVMGGRVVDCRLSVWGASMTVAGLSYPREMIAVLAGPLVSLSAALAAARFGYDMFAGLNLVAGLYNLLPARCLDGGRFLELAVCSRGNFRAAHVLLTFTTIGSALLLAVPLILAFRGGIYNWSLLASVVLLGLNGLNAKE